MGVVVIVVFFKLLGFFFDIDVKEQMYQLYGQQNVVDVEWICYCVVYFYLIDYFEWYVEIVQNLLFGFQCWCVGYCIGEDIEYYWERNIEQFMQYCGYQVVEDNDKNSEQIELQVRDLQ